MSVLSDSRGKLQALLGTIAETDNSYRIAQEALAKLDSGEAVNLEGVGMNLQFGDTTIPVPLPQDQQALADRVADAVAFLGEELVRLWNEVYAVSHQAKQHCDEAQARAAQQATAPPVQPPAAVSPSVIPQQPGGPQQPPAQPPGQPNVRAIQTTPVSGS